MADEIGTVLRFWFEEATPEQWWKKDPGFDAEIRRRFAGLHARAAAGDLDGWAESAEGALALILVLDQFSRNIYRDDPRAWAQDAAALAVARRAVEQGFDTAFGDRDRRVFFYMPFEHSEDIADQYESVRLISALGDAEYTEFAEAHREIVERFGRFPHRNAVLGRKSTAEEVEFLKQPGSSF